MRKVHSLSYLLVPAQLCQCLAFPVVSFGPFRSEVNGSFRISQGRLQFTLFPERVRSVGQRVLVSSGS